MENMIIKIIFDSNNETKEFIERDDKFPKYTETIIRSKLY
jgi:hypothetical protein